MPVQVVVGHANPDFDSYAATVAATKLFPGAKGAFLGTQNANVRDFHHLHEEFLEFVELRGLDMGEITRLVMVDTRDPERIGEFRDVALDPDVDVIVYDHHPPAEGDILGAEDRSLEVGATTSILVHELHQQGISLTPLEASIFLLGIHEDTGSLTYPGSTAYDAHAASLLMSAGADMEVLNQYLSRTLDDEQRALLAALSESLEVWDINGQPVAVGTAVAEQYVDSASVLTHYIVEDMGYRVAVALVLMPERLQVVARSRLQEVDVGAVMTRLGGGGHPQAASAALRDTALPDALGALRGALESEVRAPLAARDIMSTPVRTITPEMSMRDAADAMARWGHGGIPVVVEGVLEGLVTRKDVDKAARHGLDHAPVKGFMARDIVTVGADITLPDLERLFADEGIGRVPVVDGERILGIVTRKDLLQAEHGDEYLDRQVPGMRKRSTTRFLDAVDGLLPGDVTKTLHELGTIAHDRGERAHVVGGFVRDMLLGHESLDIDIVVEGDAVEFAHAAGEIMDARVKIHRRFGTAILVMSKELHVDCASARTEYYARPGALPTIERSSLRQDLFRRDFSVNAMAACINPDCFGAITDPFGGLADVEGHRLRVLHSLSFVEDPTRVLRGARFEVRHGFAMDSSTEELARRAVEMEMLEEVSGARLREEMLDIIDEDVPVAVFERLIDLGAAAVLLPLNQDATHSSATLAATTAAYDVLAPRFKRVPRRRVTLVASLAQGTSPRDAQRWLKHLRFGREYGDPILSVAEEVPGVARRLQDGRAMRDSRLFRTIQGVPDEAVIVMWATCEEIARERIERYLDVLVPTRPAVSGEDLKELGMTPGPGFSAILSQALDDRIDGKAVGREEELANLKRLASRAGRTET